MSLQGQHFPSKTTDNRSQQVFHGEEILTQLSLHITRQYMWHRRTRHIDFIYKPYKYEKIYRGSAETTAVPPNFNAPEDGLAGRNT
jgi:hypothetical protein